MHILHLKCSHAAYLSSGSVGVMQTAARGSDFCLASATYNSGGMEQEALEKVNYTCDPDYYRNLPPKTSGALCLRLELLYCPVLGQLLRFQWLVDILVGQGAGL